MAQTAGKEVYHVEVVRFGHREPLEVPQSRVLTFPRGMVGMEDLRRFALLEDERIAPCRWLQSLDNPALVFVVVDPHLVDPGYQAAVPEEDVAALEMEGPRDADLWALVTVQPGPGDATANLLAPIVINRRRRLGMQVILHHSDYSLRHPIGPPPSARSAAEPETTNHAGAHAEG
jgi:flagellar assembly factor FliW